MEEEKLSLFGNGDAAPAEETPPEQEQAAPEPVQPITGEDVTPPVTDGKGGHIPIQALLDEREKRQELQRRLEDESRSRQESERRLQAFMAQRQQVKPPDFFENPDAALQARMDPIRQQMLSERLDMSELMASEKHGQEIVEAAKQAFLSVAPRNPALHQQILSERHPYDAVVKWYKRATAMQKIGDDPDAYIDAEVERRLQERLSQSPAPQQPQQRLPVSLASAPSAGKGSNNTAPSGPPQLRALFG